MKITGLGALSLSVVTPLMLATHTSCPGRSAKMSEASFWGHDLLRLLDGRHGCISDEYLQEAFTRMEPRFYCVSGSSSPPTSIDACQRAVNASSRLHIQVYCEKKHLIGEITDFGLLTSDRDKGKLIDDEIQCRHETDIVVSLKKPRQSTSSRHHGSVTLHLKLDLEFWGLSTVFESDNWTGPRTVEDLARIGVVTKVLQADLDRFGMSPAWSSLLESLAILVRFGGRIAEVRSTLDGRIMLTAVRSWIPRPR
jgi:hypothetical protein